METVSAPAATPVNWEAVRMLAAVVGVRESARQMGLSEEQVKKRCTREGWLSTPEARIANQRAVAQRSGTSAPVPLSPMSPAALVNAELAALGSKTRLSFARGVAKAAEHVETLSGSDILTESGNVKAIAQTADLVHGWKDAAPQVKIRLDVLNGSAEAAPIDVEASVSGDVKTNQPMQTENYTGRDAKHEIAFLSDALQSSTQENGLKEWKPETGEARRNQGFASAGNAAKWLKRLLSQAGWPQATQWQIRPATVNPAPWENDQAPRNVFRVYLVKEAHKPTPSVESNLRAILALCDNPHFDSSRKYRIAELASEAIALLSK